VKGFRIAEKKRGDLSLKQVLSGRVPFLSGRASSDALKGCAALPLSAPLFLLLSFFKKKKKYIYIYIYISFLFLFLFLVYFLFSIFFSLDFKNVLLHF